MENRELSEKTNDNFLRKIVFAVLTLAFFLVPLYCETVRDYAPGIAVISGIIFAVTWGNPFAKFTAKITSPLLGASIVGMGFGMNLITVLRAGMSGMVYTQIGIAAGMGLGFLIGKKLKVPGNITWLISVGTSICGGSAIAAAAPVLKAKSHDVAIASATVFTLNAIALLVFPAVGHLSGFTENQFGYWAALAIHDTSSVVGASFQYGPTALEVGTTVKLARALWIVPVTVFLACFIAGSAEGEEKRKIQFKIPWFIPGFLAAAALVTYLPVTASVGSSIKEIAKYMMIATLFLIGSNLSREKIRTIGLKPVVQGIILWIVLAGAWYTAIYAGWVNCAS